MKLVTPLIDEVEAALSSLLPAASKIALDAFHATETKEFSKNDHIDFTTQADLDIDHYLIDNLKRSFPLAEFLTEETAENHDFDTFRASDFLFVIDPIDGTTNFSRGNPNFAISVGLVVKGRTVLGAVCLPPEKKIIIVREDKKEISVNSQAEKWHVSETKTLNRSIVLLDMPHNVSLKPTVGKWVNTLSNEVRRVGMQGSAVADMLKVASGEIDAYIMPGLLPWDVAAVCLILEKCGATISSAGTDNWDVFCPDIIASNGHIHKPLLRLLSST